MINNRQPDVMADVVISVVKVTSTTCRCSPFIASRNCISPLARPESHYRPRFDHTYFTTRLRPAEISAPAYVRCNLI